MRNLSSAGWEKLKKKLQEPDPSNVDTEFVDAHNGAVYLEELKGFDPADEEDQEDYLWKRIRPELSCSSFEAWRKIIDGMGTEQLDDLRQVLDENRTDAINAIGRAKYANVRGYLAAIWVSRGRVVEISGPMHLLALDNHRSVPFGPPPSDRKLGKMLGVDGKTIKAWRERMLEDWPPPEGDTRLDYFRNIVKPPRERRPP